MTMALAPWVRTMVVGYAAAVAACGAPAAASPSDAPRPTRAPASSAPSADAAVAMAPAAPVDLSFLGPNDALEPVATADTRVVVVVRAKGRSVDAASYALAGEDVFAAPRGLLIEGGCVRSVVKVPRTITLGNGLVRASDAAALDLQGARGDLADLRVAFAGLPQRSYGDFAWSGALALARGPGIGPTVWLQRGDEIRKLTLPTKSVAGVAVLADGAAYVGLGHFGDAGSGALARLDPNSGALTSLPLASVEGMLPLGPSTLLVLRYDVAKRVTCLEQLQSSGAVDRVMCAPGKPSRLPSLTLSSDAKRAAFKVHGAKMDSTHVVDLAGRRLVQRAKETSVRPALSQAGALAMQSPVGPGPIVVWNDGVSKKVEIPGVLAGFTDRDELLVVDERAILSGQTCNVTRVVAAR